jgi:hypothetical protein
LTTCEGDLSGLCCRPSAGRPTETPEPRSLGAARFRTGWKVGTLHRWRIAAPWRMVGRPACWVGAVSSQHSSRGNIPKSRTLSRMRRACVNAAVIEPLNQLATVPFPLSASLPADRAPAGPLPLSASRYPPERHDHAEGSRGPRHSTTRRATCSGQGRKDSI